MNFVLGKALLSVLFYTDNPYFFITFSKFLSLLFPYFSVDVHLKACTQALSQVKINKNVQRKIVNIFLHIIFSICFMCSKEPSH